MTRHMRSPAIEKGSGVAILTEVKCKRCGKHWGIHYGYEPWASIDKLSSWCFERGCGTSIARDYSSADRVPLFWDIAFDT